jgi:methyl-accepting chemotaxis protein
MKKVSLGVKLIGGFGIAVLLMVVLIVSNMVQLTQLRHLQDEGANRAAAAVFATESAGMSARLYQIAADAIINRNLAEASKKWTETQAKTTADLDKLESLVDTTEEKGLLASARGSHKAYAQIVEKELFPLLGKAGEVTEAIKALDGKIDDLAGQMAQALTSLAGSLSKESKEADVEFDRVMYRVIMTSLIMGGAIAVIALLMGIFLTRAITRPINRVVSGLTDGGNQIAAAAAQVSSASQSLAEGSSEQASSLEETSSSLEEMSSMTRRNAENAGQARAMMGDARRVVEKVSGHMDEMSKAIGEITKTSEETGKIIKTIDEIAFQTNLLALNAAVEAARAGEAGAGFAVVADEVRNLALRAADAARNTNVLIENTIKAVKNGNDLTRMTQEAFKENISISGKIGELVEEIATASEEQSRGIAQVNTAVLEMNKITQSTAASAEESASASEELNAQAEQIKGFIGDLNAVIGGSRGGAEHPAALGLGASPARGKAPKLLALPAASGRKGGRAAAKSQGPRPEKQIPLAEGEFKDF